MGSNIGGVLQSVKECLTNSNAQPFDSDESSAQLTRVSDEFDYWKRYEMNAASPQMKKKGAYYNSVYKEIDEKWRKLSSLKLPALKELIEVTLDCLDKAWINDYGYPPTRFSKLISLFSNALWTRLGQHLPRIEPGCRPQLNEIDDIFTYWINTVKEYK